MISQAAIIQQIQQTAQAYGVDPALAVQVARQESGFNQNARGAAGEIGIFQLMPATAADLGVNPYDLTQNIQGGVRYLKELLTSFGGDVSKALAAYNAGPGRVGQAVESGSSWFSLIPATTQKYVSAILAALGIGKTSPAWSQSAAGGPVAVATATPEIQLPGGNYVVLASGPTLASSNWLWIAALGAGALLLAYSD